MKKSFLLSFFALIVLSLTAFSFVSWNRTHTVRVPMQDPGKDSVCRKDLSYFLGPVLEPEMFFDVSTRFNATVSKDKLHQAASILDIIPTEGTQGLENFHTVSVSVIRNGKDVTENGHGDALNAAQLELLRTVDHSTNIHINSLCMQRNPNTGELQNYDVVYYITVTPQKQAQYLGGREALIDLLKTGIAGKTYVIASDKLESGQINFTVSAKGTVEHVRLASSCGYATIDEALLEQVRNMPLRWTPATDASEKAVDQELVFFFGTQGC